MREIKAGTSSKDMTTPVESIPSSVEQTAATPSGGWFKLGVIAAASAALGGLAAAWWYRKTLAKLQQAGETAENPDFGSSGEDMSDGM